MPKRRGEKNRISVEEQGQRAARSTDVYLDESGHKGVAMCTRCHAYNFNKRWYLQEEALKLLQGVESVGETVCPSCRRMADNIPEGIVTLAGTYLLHHEDEILNRVRRVEEQARAKNPLARIMEIQQDGRIVTIYTTDEKLAQKLGRDVHKAHKGSLEYNWSGNENFLRVNWSREA